MLDGGWYSLEAKAASGLSTSRFPRGEVAKVPYLQVSVNDGIQGSTSAWTPDGERDHETMPTPKVPHEPAPIWHPQLL